MLRVITNSLEIVSVTFYAITVLTTVLNEKKSIGVRSRKQVGSFHPSDQSVIGNRIENFKFG